MDIAERNPLEQGLERYVGLEHLDSESLYIKRWGQIAEGTSFTRTFKTGQVLFGKRRAYQRKVAVAEFDGLCSGDILVFEPANDALSPDLLPFIVQSEGFFNHALGTSAGSLSPRTRWRDLAEYLFALPPRDEQHRIAEILWAAEEVVVKSTAVLETLKNYQQIFFENAIRNGVSNGWEQVSFESLWTRSPKSGYSATPSEQYTGFYVLSLSSIGETGYQRNEMKPVKITPQVEDTRIKKGDVLISRSNTIEFVGFAGIFDEDRDDVSFPDTMMLLYLDEKRIDKNFLVKFLLSRSGRSQIRKIAAGTSASMKKINRSGLGSIKIPVPEMNIQKNIVNSVFDIEDRISKTKLYLVKVVNLYQELREKLMNPIS